MQRTVLLWLLAISLHTAVDAKKKKRRPALPAELGDGCPFHLDAASAEELSEFGHELERDGRQPEAVHCYARAIRAHPTETLGWFDLATAWQYSDQRKALQLYRHGLSLKPDSAFHYSQLGVLLRSSERHDEAVESFRTATRLHPADPDAWFHLGGSHEALERHEEALHAYRGSLECETKNEARIQNNLANVLGKLGRWPDALVSYREAAEADPTFPETQWNLAHVLMELKRFEEAEPHLRAARRLSPDDARVEAKWAEWQELMAKREADMRKELVYEKIEERDGELSREERVARFQEADQKKICEQKAE